MASRAVWGTRSVIWSLELAERWKIFLWQNGRFFYGRTENFFRGGMEDFCVAERKIFLSITHCNRLVFVQVAAPVFKGGRVSRLRSFRGLVMQVFETHDNPRRFMLEPVRLQFPTCATCFSIDNRTFKAVRKIGQGAQPRALRHGCRSFSGQENACGLDPRHP